ncbi:MAG: helix-turn-helix domain-containing protein [Bacteroidota bacterium]
MERIDSTQLNASEVDAIDTLLQGKRRPALVDGDGNRLELPEPIFKLLVHVIQQWKEGRTIVLMPEDETLTTQAAANFLGVSRQFLVNLLEAGDIEFHKVGSHRRVYLRDLKAYMEQRDKSRRKAMDQLFDNVSKAGKYESDYTGDDS